MDDWRGAARSLARRELIERIAIPASQFAPTPQPGPETNAEHAAAIATLGDVDGLAAPLPDGVTGRGKPEVHLHATPHCPPTGTQARALVPELGLAPTIPAAPTTHPAPP